MTLQNHANLQKAPNGREMRQKKDQEINLSI